MVDFCVLSLPSIHIYVCIVARERSLGTADSIAPLKSFKKKVGIPVSFYFPFFGNYEPEQQKHQIF